MKTMEAAARLVLTTADPEKKCRAAFEAAKAWRSGALTLGENGVALPDRPARPSTPQLTAPRDVPKRGLGSEAGRIALLHALAHIEFNAIDLAFDMAARFAGECGGKLGKAEEFVDDWFSVGEDEARHFTMLNRRLEELGSHYGALNAHDGLWQAALATRGSWRARLSVVPMVLEARGLDVTPQTVEKLRAQGDNKSAEILDEIYRDEIGHVAKGVKWFQQVCQAEGLDEESSFHNDLEAFFKGTLKGPFNQEARSKAGLLPKLYMGR